jgi:hypothetical protein
MSGGTPSATPAKGVKPEDFDEGTDCSPSDRGKGP